MEKLLPDFQLDSTTWFYLSSLLVVALYFRFSRPWSLRNFDLILLLSLSPGLLMIEAGMRSGYAWLFGVSALLLVRLLCDGLFRRRTRGSQNLNMAGLVFLMAACGLFHLVETFTTNRLPAAALETTSRAERMVRRQDTSQLEASEPSSQEPSAGPAAAVLTAPALGISHAVTGRATVSAETAGGVRFVELATRIAAVIANASVIVALLFLGGRMFHDWYLGVAMATLYLILPCTALHVAHVNHILPGALILWAVIGYRLPYLSGGLIGLACGTMFFPVFLLPMWGLFYGWRNMLRFTAAVLAVWIGLLGSIALTAADSESFIRQVVGQFDGSMLLFSDMQTTGLWAGIDGVYRMPVFALYLVLVGVLSWWPKSRSVESLLSRSTALIVGTQFWFPYEGGMYLLWYVPLLLAVMFRPALPHQVPPAAGPWFWQRWKVRRPQAAQQPAAEPVSPGTPLVVEVRAVRPASNGFVSPAAAKNDHFIPARSPIPQAP